MQGGHIGGPFYCIGEIIGLGSFYLYFSGSAKEERQRGLKTDHLEFHIQAWPASLKEPLRCGFKRNSLCGTGAGREPSVEETLQCVSVRGADDLACCLKLGVGKGNGTFHFCFYFCFFFSPLGGF